MSEYQDQVTLQHLQHAKERKDKLNEQKAAYSVPDNAEKNSKQNPKKERGMGRPNFKGLGNYGASSPQGNCRGRS